MLLANNYSYDKLPPMNELKPVPGAVKSSSAGEVSTNSRLLLQKSTPSDSREMRLSFCILKCICLKKKNVKDSDGAWLFPVSSCLLLGCGLSDLDLFLVSACGWVRGLLMPPRSCVAVGISDVKNLVVFWFCWCADERTMTRPCNFNIYLKILGPGKIADTYCYLVQGKNELSLELSGVKRLVK